MSLSTVEGGRHDGLGTHNRIVPLGGGYLELMAVYDAERVDRSGVARALHSRIEEAAEGLCAWCVAVDDIDAVAKRLGTSLLTVRREGLSAQVTGLPEALAEPFLPFFISRDEGVRDPGSGADAGGITWVEVAGDEERVNAWLGDHPLPVRVVEGPQGVRAMGIGTRELRTE